MKLISTTVSYEGFNQANQTETLLKIAERAIEKASKLDADILVLPAGFFMCRNSALRDENALSLIEIAKQFNIAIIFGIDQQEKNLSDDYVQEIIEERLPFWCYAWSRNDGIKYWNQRSTNSANQKYASDKICNDLRTITVNGEKLAILMCGEIFNRRIRDTLANNSKNIKVVADVAHKGRQFRIDGSMRILANSGLSSVCSVHVQKEFAMKRCYRASGTKLSTTTYDTYVYGPPRIEMKLWTF